jgi:6-phosphogluconolactonase
MGNDGHTASLFPGQENPYENNAAVIAVTAHYQDRPANRVSLTPAVINNAAQIVFLVTGAAKADALYSVLHGIYDPINLPAQRIEPWKGTLAWLVDSTAAAQLPK